MTKENKFQQKQQVPPGTPTIMDSISDEAEEVHGKISGWAKNYRIAVQVALKSNDQITALTALLAERDKEIAELKKAVSGAVVPGASGGSSRSKK